ncbi:MAG TPA: hypothetical protein VFG59_09205 [Anaeromyxobacter sp.]|nr:hypothetical protein [Anaeromyxobacter sp.]
MLSPVLAFRPASALARLAPRSDACPVSLTDLLAAAGGLRLPSIAAGTPDVIRAALVAAKVLRSAVGLSIPRGLEPEPWFETAARSADEIAAALPYFLTAEVVLEGESAILLERVGREVWRLIEAGLTHVAFDVASVAAEERGRVLAEVAAPLAERGLCFDCVVAPGEVGAGMRTLALVEELERRGVPAAVVSVRCPAPPDAESARVQLGALDRLGRALGGLPVLRRGPVSAALLAALRGSGVRGCEDGGVAARASGESPAPEPMGEEAAERRARWRDRAAALLGAEQVERLEARAFVEAAEFIEALGAEGSAPAVARGLERQLAQDRG